MGTDKLGGRRAVFLDRDGVINRNVWNPATGTYESPRTADDFDLIPGAVGGMRALRVAGFLLFLVSNQPNYAKGKASLGTLNAIHEKLFTNLVRESIEFAEFYYCLHHPQGTIAGYSGPCQCRKPSPYFLLKAQGEFGLNLRQSWMIGDRQTDMECGRAAGSRTIFVHADESSPHRGVWSDGIVPNLFTAARLILAARKTRHC
jgi:D-glycero-D-manno-heptose 1,7-bisphosphate phosphatase